VLGLKAKNGTKPNGTQTFTLTIGQAPTITSKQSVAVTVGSAVNFPITTTGFPIAAISETGVLPAGLTFTDKGTGVARLHGTPSVGTSGTYPITIIAKNGAKPNGKQSLRIVVNDPVVAATAMPSISRLSTAAGSELAIDAVILSGVGDDTIVGG
jgi:hypothetical protein